MANERLQLEIVSSVTGNDAINKLADSLNRVVDTSLKAAKSTSESIQTPKNLQAFGSGIDQWVNQPLTSASKALQEVTVRIGGLGAAGAGVAAGFVAAGAAVLKFASDTANMARQMELMAARTGLSTTAAQQWSQMARLAGVDAGGLETMMRKLSQAISDSSAAGRKGRDALAELGIATADVGGKLRPMDQLLPEIFKKLGAIPDVTQRNVVALNLLGRSYLEVVPLAAKMDELAAAQKRWGYVMDSEGIKKADDFRRKMAELGLAWDALKLKLGQKAIVVIESIWRGSTNPSIESSGTGDVFQRGYGGGAYATHSGPSFAGPDMMPRKRPPSPGLTNDFVSDIFTTADVSRGNSIIDRFRTQDANTAAGAQYQYESAKGRAEEARVRFEQSRGAGTSAVTAAKKEMDDAAAAAARAEVRFKALAKAESELANAGERLAEIQKQANDKFSKSIFSGDRSAYAKYMDSSNDLGTREALATSKNGSNTPEVRAAFGKERDALFLTYLSDAKKEMEEIRDLTDKIGMSVKDVFGGAPVSPAEQHKRVMGVFNSGNPEFQSGEVDPYFLKSLMGVGTIAPPPGYVSPERQLRDSGDMGRRMLALAPGMNSLTGGTQGQQIGAQFNIRVATANAEYAAEQRLAELKETDAEKEQAREDAKDRHQQQIDDAQLERMQAMLELAAKQKEEFQSAAVGFYSAGRAGGGRGLVQWAKGAEQGVENKIVSNIAGLAQPEIQKVLGGMSGPGGVMGKILKGVPIIGGNPMNGAMDQNTYATSQNTESTQALSDAMTQLMQLIPGSASYNPSGVSGSALSSYGGSTFGGILSAIPGGSALSGVAKIASLLAPNASYGVSSLASPSSFTNLGSFESQGTAFGSWANAAASRPVDLVGTYAANPGAYNSMIGSGSFKGPSLSTSAGIGIGAIAAGTAFAAYSGFKAGGLQGSMTGISALGGGLAGIGSILQTIGAVGSAVPLVGAIVSTATGLIAGLLGDPKANRERDITRNLKYSQFLAPVAINESMSTSGYYADVDRYGNARTSNLSAQPRIEQGYFDYKHNVTVPGRVSSSFGGPAGNVPVSTTPGVTVIQNFSALDSRSLIDRSADLASAINHAINTGRAPGLQQTLRNQ